MKIALYSESPATGPGGAEYCVAVAAEFLSKNHQVEIFHHKPTEAVCLWKEYFGCDLGRVTFRPIERELDLSSNRWFPWSRARESRKWHAQLSVGSDVFIAFLHGKPPFCHARKGLLVTLFPTFKPGIKFTTKSRSNKKQGPRNNAPKLPVCGAGVFQWEWLHRFYNRREWDNRMNTYQRKFSISEFTRVWTLKRWGCNSNILHPPVETNFQSTLKQNVILSVGRFSASGHSKRQPVMIEMFQKLTSDFPGWQYYCLGGVCEEAEDIALFQYCLEQAKEGPIQVQANVSKSRIKEIFEESAIFWHAAGYGDDEKKRPEDAEHFGISTVEAMAAGCVPVVINKGGQPEIVEHGVSGFVWNTLEELEKYTRMLVSNPDLRSQMSAAARKRADFFNKATFVSKLVSHLPTDL